MKYILFFLCLIVGMYGISILLQNTTHFVLPFIKKPIIAIDNKTFALILAVTPQEQAKGLGYRQSLPKNEGMLFLFPHPYYEAFWMKGMEFPLDIIYIKNDHIISIYQNLSNPTEQHQETPTITPSLPANSVLEINAGLTHKYGFKIGDRVNIAL